MGLRSFGEGDGRRNRERAADFKRRITILNRGHHGISLLAEHAAAYGIMLSARELDLFYTYLEELWEWNKRFNLTGLENRDKMVVELFLDSLVPAPFLPAEGKMLDVGSGAGFPGVPLKIHCPRLDIHLLEPNSRRASFLKQIIRLLKLKGIRVIQKRIEMLEKGLEEEKYDLITARAIANLHQTLLWCAPLLEKGRSLVTFLGAEGEREVEKNREILVKYGLHVQRKISYLLPGKKSKRHTFILVRSMCGGSASAGLTEEQ
jgi:16S rRNA (guanine527-N7)-methyltransferase